ncbi:MAG: radical SAM family heme chaperone HemW [Clostridia bacterium]|nr:radical SAM family heme chaperone HemW [Clostridia bacterium]
MQFSFNERRRLGLYFHIPFCLSKCAYCDFNSAPAQSDEVISNYIGALIAHIESYRSAAAGYEPDTVFIGGGTPTSIPPEELVRLIRAIKKNFKLTRRAEFTIEANPATVTYASLRRLHRLGVNRQSMGLQSAHENELKALGRKHSRKDFVRSYRMARDAKFENINVDLMFGIPHQTYDSLMHTIRYVCGMQPDHISLYDLKIEPGTVFGQRYSEIKPLLPDDDTEADMYIGAIELLRQYGYLQYEISNFARPGSMCAHNLKYWNCDEYLGFGVSAHSYFNGSRFSFTQDIDRYMQGVTVKESKIRITDQCETVEERERMGEYIMLRLRLTAGIDDREFTRRFGYSFEEMYGKKCRKFIDNGFMTGHNGVFTLTPTGMFISNYILSDLLEFEDFGRYYFGG